MTLERFCRGRLVVLQATDTAHDAACAMSSNHVGAVLVMKKGTLAGIVTDRDLALKVVAPDFKPSRIRLSQVMTADPVTLETTDNIDQALAMMHALHVRRVVVVDARWHPRGIVTLDDLILSGEVQKNRLREVVFGQLTDASPAKPEGLVRPVRLRRRVAAGPERQRQHRAQTLRTFTDKVKKITGLGSDRDARAAFEVVAAGLARRLTPDEAADFLAQLPALMRERLSEASRGGPDRRITQHAIEREMGQRLSVVPQRAAELVSRIGHAMGEFISEGELADVHAQLPAGLKPLLHAHGAAQLQ